MNPEDLNRDRVAMILRNMAIRITEMANTVAVLSDAVTGGEFDKELPPGIATPVEIVDAEVCDT